MAQLDYVSSRYSTYRKREVEGCDEEQCLFRMSDTKTSRRIQRSLPSATLELDISVPRPGTSGRLQRPVRRVRDTYARENHRPRGAGTLGSRVDRAAHVVDDFGEVSRATRTPTNRAYRSHVQRSRCISSPQNKKDGV